VGAKAARKHVGEIDPWSHFCLKQKQNKKNQIENS